MSSAVQHGACLSTETCCPDQGSRVLSVLIEGRWLSQNQVVDDVVGLQMAGTTLRQVSASAEDIGDIDRRTSCLRVVIGW